MSSYRMGDLISFTYPAVKQQGTEAHDKFPQVLVLHPGWQGLMHGLNFNYLTDDEINMLRMMIGDTGFATVYVDNLFKKNPNLVREMDAIMAKAAFTNIASPQDFYQKVIKPFIKSRGYDPYRRYRPDKMTAARIIQKSDFMTGRNKESTFGTSDIRTKGKSEKDILQDLAQREALEDTGAHHNLLTPQERRFLDRLRGNALRVFDEFKRKFQYAKGPRLPTFRR